MKIGDVVKYKSASKPTPSDWRSLLHNRIGIITKVCDNGARAIVSYPGLQYSPYDLLARDLEIISEA